MVSNSKIQVRYLSQTQAVRPPFSKPPKKKLLNKYHELPFPSTPPKNLSMHSLVSIISQLHWLSARRYTTRRSIGLHNGFLSRSTPSTQNLSVTAPVPNGEKGAAVAAVVLGVFERVD